MSENEIKPVAWITDDFLTDKSSTTYEHETAERWRQKNWPVDPLYDQSAIDRLTAERDAAVAERDAVRNAIGNDMLKSYIEKHGDPVPLVLELEEAKRKLSVAVAEGKGLVADAERMDFIDAEMKKNGSVVFYGYGMDWTRVFTVTSQHTSHFPTARRAIDAARAEGGV